MNQANSIKYFYIILGIIRHRGNQVNKKKPDESSPRHSTIRSLQATVKEPQADGGISGGLIEALSAQAGLQDRSAPESRTEASHPLYHII